MEKYALIVVGSGPGGQRAAIQAAKFGKRAALVEKLEVIGGTAINTGTIPSKTIREAVLHLSGYQYQSIYGVNYRVKEPITMADLSFRALNVIKTEIDVIRAQLSRNGIDVLTGTASFLDPHRIQVTSARGQAEVDSEHIIVATGTKPAVSPLVPFNNKTIINSDQILSMPEIPKAMIVVGGGVIGVEYVCMLATLSAFPAWAPFPWSRAASPPRKLLACRCIPTARIIPTGFTRFRKFRSSAKRKSSSPTKACLTKWAWRTSVKLRAARFAATPPA